jgi:hypothetical protein
MQKQAAHLKMLTKFATQQPDHRAPNWGQKATRAICVRSRVVTCLILLIYTAALRISSR